MVSTHLKKYQSNWIISPKIGMNIKHIWNHHLDIGWILPFWNTSCWYTSLELTLLTPLTPFPPQQQQHATLVVGCPNLSIAFSILGEAGLAPGWLFRFLGKELTEKCDQKMGKNCGFFFGANGFFCSYIKHLYNKIICISYRYIYILTTWGSLWKFYKKRPVGIFPSKP